MGFKEAWHHAGQDADDDFDPADGAYHVRLVDAGAFTTRTSGRDKVKLTWQIIGGDDAGHRIVDFNDFDDSNPVGCRIVGEKLALLGLDPRETELDDVEDLDHALFNVIGAVADITVKHNDTFLNVSLDRVDSGGSDVTPRDELDLTPPAPPAAPSSRDAFAQVLDDDIPF